MPSPVEAVLFDLDGTLVDTVADISAALNRALAEQADAALPQAEVRSLIGRGVPSLIERAAAHLAATHVTLDAARLLERFRFHYARIQAGPEMHSRVYPGVAGGLAELHALGLKLAVVTNKPARMAAELLTRLELDSLIDALVSGDRSPYKPHPEPLLRACERLAAAPARAVMVGDSLIDVLAARGAGMRIVCVPYGYNEGEDPRTLPCDGFIESIAELAAWLRASGALDGRAA